jgi:hypothetical protein
MKRDVLSAFLMSKNGFPAGPAEQQSTLEETGKGSH